MSISSAVAWVDSDDTDLNLKGIAIVINSAATSTNLPDILKHDLLNKMIRFLRSNNNDVVMKACWAISNICVHEQGRVLAHKNGIINHLNPVFSTSNPQIIEKGCWILTNLTKISAAQGDLARSNIPSLIGKLLKSSLTEDQKASILQPLSNISLAPENQEAVARSGVIPGVVHVLSTGSQKTQQLALNFITNVTTSHNSIRDTVVDAGVLPPLGKILEGNGTVQMMEMALNCLINISHTEKGESGINRQVLPSVVGLLYSDQPNVVLQATTLMSNLCTKQDIRENLRLYGWVEPLVSAIDKGTDQFLQQALRVVINMSIDSNCRHMMVVANLHTKIGTRAKSINNEQITKLTVQALQNLKAPVSPQIEAEVMDAMKTGKIRKIQPPRAKQTVQKKDDFEGLDDLLNDITKG